MRWAAALLTRAFGSPEEINGHERCPTYMYRWTVLSTRRFKVYVHRFVADDWSRDLHDHPKRFVSIGLWGRYLEHGPAGRRREYRAPWFRTFPATHIHRVTLPAGDCWTLVIVGPPVREWGFWHLDPIEHGPVQGAWRWIPWRAYVRPGNEVANKMKACP
jgi:hypothetical protein